MDKDTVLLRTGIVGTIIAALCCFTPILVILFGVIGLSAVIGYLGFVLLPALALFLGLTAYALYRLYRKRRGRGTDVPSQS